MKGRAPDPFLLFFVGSLRARPLARLGDGGPVVAFLFFFVRGLRAGLVILAASARRYADSGAVVTPDAACRDKENFVVQGPRREYCPALFMFGAG